MDPRFAIKMENWLPDSGKVMIRKGSAEVASAIGAGGNVVALGAYINGADKEFIASEGGTLSHISIGGTVTSIETGLSGDDWIFEPFKERLFFANGVDGIRTWDGTVLATPAFTGSGFVAANIRGLRSFSERLFMWEVNKPHFWYGELSAIAGTMTKFDLSTVAKQGGSIVGAERISREGEGSIDDMLAFFYDTGEILVYKGLNPGDASEWAKIGNYFAPAITDIRAVLQLDGDLLLQTRTDYAKLSQVISKEDVPDSRIRPLMASSYKAASALTQWQAVRSATHGLSIFNVPQTDGSFRQHVLNNANGFWTTYKGLDARCWAHLDGELYFGTSDGRIVQAEIGVEDEGAAIEALGGTAWNQLGIPGDKIARAMRSIIKSNGAANYSIALNFDFGEDAAASPLATALGATAWGSPWGSPWSATSVIDSNWRLAAGIGDFLSIEMRATGRQAIEWLRSDVRVEKAR